MIPSPQARWWPHRPDPVKKGYSAEAVARWKKLYPAEAERYHRYIYVQRSYERGVVPPPFKINKKLLEEARKTLHSSAG